MIQSRHDTCLARVMRLVGRQRPAESRARSNSSACSSVQTIDAPFRRRLSTVRAVAGRPCPPTLRRSSAGFEKREHSRPVAVNVRNRKPWII